LSDLARQIRKRLSTSWSLCEEQVTLKSLSVKVLENRALLAVKSRDSAWGDLPEYISAIKYSDPGSTACHPCQ
jgi:hypothetical protein